VRCGVTGVPRCAGRPTAQCSQLGDHSAALAALTALTALSSPSGTRPTRPGDRPQREEKARAAARADPPAEAEAGLSERARAFLHALAQEVRGARERVRSCLHVVRAGGRLGRVWVVCVVWLVLSAAISSADSNALERVCSMSLLGGL
jgi:hypothetical protein